MSNRSEPASRRTARRSRFLAAVGATAALLLTACGGGPAASSKADAPVVPQPAEYAKVPVPGGPIQPGPLRGKTVYFIPITSQAPIFGIEQRAAQEAFSAVGARLQLCDGKASPDAVGQCVQQAVSSGAAGIIATSIPPEFSQQSFASAVQARVPVLFVNTKDATVPAAWGKLAAALPSNFVQQADLNDQLIIDDSGGKANVLLVEVTDSSVTTSTYEDGMLAYLKKNCPGCTVDTVQTGATTVSNLTSQVSAALTRNPATNYVYAQYDSFAPPVVAALRQMNRAKSVKLVTSLGQLDGLQRLDQGAAFADTGYSIAALGWNEADIMMRLVLGVDPRVAAHVSPIKTFTQGNVNGLDLSEAGWLSGRWTSSDDFRAMYKQLWGGV